MRLRAALAALAVAAALAAVWWGPARRSPAPDPSGPPGAAASGAPGLDALPAAQRAAAGRRAEVRREAMGPGALPRLEARWQATSDGAVREQVLLELARLGTPEAALRLAAVAAGDERLGARAGAALGTVRSPAAADALASVAAGDGPVIARANAARALGASGGPGQAPLLAALASDPGQPLRVRQESALALGRIGGEAGAPALAGALEAAAADPGPEAEQLRISLARGLGGIGGSSAIAALARHAGRSLSPVERAFVERAAAAARR